MILSRVWYVLLGLAVAVALYVVYVAVGQHNRRGTLALKEGLASDSQTVEWALKIDARRRLDALLPGSVDAALQQALVGANGAKDGKLPDKAKADARKALATIHDAIPADWRCDALFAVDREGRVVAEVGYEAAATNDDFELGGYPAVNDALHGWLRDDVWVLGGKMYVIAARPVEYDVTQRPAGAIVGLNEVSRKLADDLAKRTRTNIAFFASGQRVAGGVGVEGFDPEKLDAVANDLKSIDDRTYGAAGRSDVRMISDELGAMYARLPGDAWALGGGFAVARSGAVLASPLGFLSSADDKDKANVPWLLLAGAVLAAALVGIGLTVLEHSQPLGELVMQADRLKRGAMEGLQVARFRGAYRLAAQSINEGIERAIERAGGVTRKPADLESILGPAPAQPSMSAFSFPTADGAPSAPSSGSASSPGVHPSWMSAPTAPRMNNPLAGAGVSGPRPPFPSPGNRPAPPPPAPRPFTAAPNDDDEATTVGAVPAELMAEAAGGNRAAAEDAAEWPSVYEAFTRTRQQCGESIEGLTFEKFCHTLRKHRDALVVRHGCKRVKFNVSVKDGKASLKAMPIKD